MPSFRPALAATVLLSLVAFVGAAMGGEPRVECPSGAKVYGQRPRPARGAEPLDPTANYAVAFQEVCQSKDPDGRLVFNGRAMAYYLDGTPMCRAEYAWGEPSGTWTCWYVGGAVRSEQHFGGPGEPAWSVDYDRTGAAVRKTYRDGRVEKEQHVDAEGEVERAVQYDRSGAVVKQAGVASEGDNPEPVHVVHADVLPPPPVSLVVTGFSAANAEVIQAQEAALEERLAFLTDSSGVSVSVELARGSGGVLVTVEERVQGPVEGLGLIQGPMGHKAVSLGRARLSATYVSAWVGIGPGRAAAQAGNMALAEALVHRAILVRYGNARGSVLSMSFVPASNGQVVFEGLVWVTDGRTTTEVAVDPSTGLLPLPTGADGRPTTAMKVYEFFGATP